MPDDTIRSGAFSSLQDIFKPGARLDFQLLAVFILINAIVLFNACFHDPLINYDPAAHLKYYEILSTGRFPVPMESKEYFCPPLPYTFPAGLMAFTGMSKFRAAKCAQGLNFFLSLGLLFYLLKTCHLLDPRPILKLGALVFLGMLPVYYRTFAFVRGEPWVAFFSVFILYYVVLILVKGRHTFKNIVILALAMGLCALSRQWGILLFPSVFVFMCLIGLRDPLRRRAALTAILASVIGIALVSGWFYVNSMMVYGSTTAFNRKPAPSFSFKNQPRHFYFSLQPGLLFSNPVYPNFPNRLLPILYSDTWGDYWGHFTVFGMDKYTLDYVNGPYIHGMRLNKQPQDHIITNYHTIGKYLGLVNLFCVFPSLLSIAALLFCLKEAFSKRQSPERREILIFVLLSIASVMLGYFWFLVRYPFPPGGYTIKATYIIHVFPFVALCVGVFLSHIEKKRKALSLILLGLLCFVMAHNIPAMITHYRLHLF